MTPFEAEQIVNKYGAALSKGKDGEIARPISLLPCSKSRIRYAYYVYLSELNKSCINKNLLDKYLITYSALYSFISDEEAVIVNKTLYKIINNQTLTEEEDELYIGFKNMMYSSGNDLDDINNFMKEC
jgi:hypothetical protein